MKMKRIIPSLLVLLCFCISAFTLNAQLRDEFLLDNVSASGVQQMFYRNKVLKVGSYTYICGATMNSSGDYDMLLSKFDAVADTLVWSATYGGGYLGDDYAADLAVDGSSNIIVVGTTQVGSLDYNAVIIKYNSSGVQQWVSTYAGAANGPDGFTTVVLNGTDVYAAGGALVNVSNMTDVLCVKYNSSGTQQWATTWNNSSNNLQDAAANVAISGPNVAVIAATQETVSTAKWSVATIRITASTGVISSTAVVVGGSAPFSEVKDIALDPSENIYVCGTREVSGQGKNIYVVKYNASLTQAWAYTKNGSANSDDEGLGLKLSTTDVFISGYTSVTSEGKNIFAAKLSQSNGAVSWEITSNLAGGDDEATGLQLDNNGNLIIPCTVDRNGTKDIGLLNLGHSTGSVITSTFYNSEYNRDEYARDIAVNPISNEVYVSTQVQVNDTTYESRIIKWKPSKVYSPKPTDGYSSYSGYIPNRMQLRATDSTANRTVLFYNQATRVATYIDNSKISYQLVLANDTTNADTTYRVDMSFIGGKPNAKVYPYNERKEYINYYLGHMDKPSIRTPLSNVVLKQDVYTNTDVLFTSSSKGFRHWFIARTGATPTSYEMNFNGQTGLSVDGSGNLVIATTIGNITYKKAKAYSMNTTTGVLTLLGWQPTYSIVGSTVKFGSIGVWSGVLVLEVDENEPTYSGFGPVSNHNMDWSTFFGNGGFEKMTDVTNDQYGNVWYCGFSTHEIFINNPGQTNDVSFGLEDVYIAHFNGECEARWITYYGGNGIDRAYGITHDPDGNIYSVGHCGSYDIDNFRLDGIDYNIVNGTNDGFFLKLNNEGEILVDSYIGGDGQDDAFDVVYRSASAGLNAATFIVGWCEDGGGFPIQYSGNVLGYDQPTGSGAFIMELDGNCELVWSTLFGSDGELHSIDIVAGLPTVIGITGATAYSVQSCTEPSDLGFPCCQNGGYLQPTFGSGRRYFVARFGEKRNLVHSTFFGPATYPIIETKPRISTAYHEYDPSSKLSFYICGKSPSSAAANFPFLTWPGSYADPYHKTYSSLDGGTFGWVAKMEVIGETTNRIGSTALRWDDEIAYVSVAADENNGVVIAGTSVISAVQTTCSVPGADNFPICDDGGEGYTESLVDASYFRSFLLQFDEEMGIKWSTPFGNSSRNATYCSSTAGNYIFIGGYSHNGTGSNVNNYTLWEYDGAFNSQDYYRSHIYGASMDATITRFHLTEPVVVNITEEQSSNSSQLLIYPNPTLDFISVSPEKALGLKVQIEIFDALGRLVLQNGATLENNRVLLDVRSLSSGLYTLKYISDGQSLTQSFIKE
jgi:hypothetical protein